MIAVLLFVALIVGTLIGAVGIGGILLIPAINLLARVPIHAAMATALLTFVFTGILGTFLFNRRGSIEWSVAVPLCLGAAVFGFIGAWANARIDGKLLSVILAVLIVIAGVNTVCTRNSGRLAPFNARPRLQQMLLLIIGAAAGFGSGLTGVGGPALSVPFMMLFGFSPLTAIGASQVVQILAAVSGTIGNLQYGNIDFGLALGLTVSEAIGVHLGVRIAHAMNGQSLRNWVGLFCVLAGAGLMIRSMAAL